MAVRVPCTASFFKVFCAAGTDDIMRPASSLAAAGAPETKPPCSWLCKMRQENATTANNATHLSQEIGISIAVVSLPAARFQVYAVVRVLPARVHPAGVER